MARRRGLTPEDRALWSRVASSATPLDPQRPAAPEPFLPARPPRDPVPKPMPLPPDFGFGVKSVPRSSHSLAPSPAEALRQQPIRMDHKTHRRMSQGRLRPEARLDLHGMTLAEAGPELAQFILSCHARGFRLVLVITGKGSRDGEEHPLPVRRGALRHQVPHWLHSAPLRLVVQQVTPAHLRHGGTGAYYVYLRR
ncbi:MAG: Smr/MutS family protein [Paracoccus sp. (in: a-proteobacteria)]|nr:Smr/MutS family protein [Paracoccus sp. (in: a-proteobacteria)]